MAIDESRQDSAVHDEFFYTLPATGCLGRREERILTVAEWLKDQGMEPYRAVNDRMLQLLFHPRRGADRALTEKQLQNIFVSLYNLDVFREFIFNTNFLEVYSLDTQVQSRIKSGDLEILEFGFSYLKTNLFT